MCAFTYLLPERIFILPWIRKFLIKEEIGRENMSTERPYIFAVNHNSHMDEFVTMPGIIMSTKRKTHFFADRKHWFQGKFYFRILAFRFQAIPIDRGKGTGDDALKKGLEYIEKGHNIIIYPEGTRGSGFELNKGKVGVGKLALWSGAPVIPVGVWGTHKLMPKGKHKPKIEKIVTVKFGQPMTFEDFKGRSGDPKAWREVTDIIMCRIGELIGVDYCY
ncbi:MAG: lysophospholipid acyltransferase family protein [Thermoplasmatota archaeon]